jgi:asparaginyl-tRNA synthetase
MESLRIRDLYKDTAAYAGKEVTVCGWVKNIRDSKTFGFLVISDGTYFSPLQVVYHDTMENFTQVCKLNVGAAVIVKGKLVLTPD